MMQGIFVLVQLRLHGAQLQMALAKVPQLEQLLGDAELLRRFNLSYGVRIVQIIVLRRLLNIIEVLEIL